MLKSFVNFFKQNYMLYEQIMYTDKTLFKHIFSEDAQPNEEQRAKIQQDYTDQVEDKPKKQNTDKNDLESIELIKKYKANPDSQAGIDARNKVIEKYTNFIHALAWRQERLGNIPENNHEDIFQNGVLALIHSIDKYDPDKGVPFLAYIKDWILAGIKNPYNMDRKQSIHGDNLSVNDSVSIDAKISGDRGQWADKDATVADTISDPNAGDSPMADSDDDLEKGKFKEYLKRLPSKELTAIKLFLIDGKNYEEIGDVLHMSKPAAKWFVQRALTRIRQFAKEEGFEQEALPKISTLKGTGSAWQDEIKQ